MKLTSEEIAEAERAIANDTEPEVLRTDYARRLNASIDVPTYTAALWRRRRELEQLVALASERP